jgi:hypothetical protein
MSFLALLWLPIVVSAVLVFVLSAISHMAVPFRRTEWAHLPVQGAIQEALRGTRPGLYAIPSPADLSQRGQPEHLKAVAEGPTAWLALVPPGPMNMGRSLGLSLLMNLFVSLVVAYLAAHVLGGVPHYRAVFRVVGTVGFLAYAVGPVYEGIWFWKPWRSFAMGTLEALAYGLAMAGTFGWLWPR